jgi:hypothetical protein
VVDYGLLREIMVRLHIQFYYFTLVVLRPLFLLGSSRCFGAPRQRMALTYDTSFSFPLHEHVMRLREKLSRSFLKDRRLSSTLSQSKA